MSITLDAVLTVAIGRNLPDGRPMGDVSWDVFQRWVAAKLVDAGGTIVAHTTGGGLGSDGQNDGQEEESCVFVAVNIHDLDGCRKAISGVLRAFDQSSACFALDIAHEPVFAATRSGWRPGSVEDTFADLLAEGNARRTMRVQ